MLGNASEHARTDFFVVMEREGKVPSPRFRENAVRAALSLYRPAGPKQRAQKMRRLNGFPLHTQRVAIRERGLFPFLLNPQACGARWPKRAGARRFWSFHTPTRPEASGLRLSSDHLLRGRIQPQETPIPFSMTTFLSCADYSTMALYEANRARPSLGGELRECLPLPYPSRTRGRTERCRNGRT
jgi:hypothetical protein